MNLVRKSVAVVLAAALVWMGVAGGLLAVSGAAAHASHGGHAHVIVQSSQHVQGAVRDTVALESFGIPSGHTHKSQRECASSCIDTITIKLLPGVAYVKAPEGNFVYALLPVEQVAGSGARVNLGYWPVGPPWDPAVASTGAARVLAYNAHLRI
jgi:uncharacterized protein (DUF2141 family)